MLVLTELIGELDKDYQLDILQKLDIEKSTKVLDLMENDDLADLLNSFMTEIPTEENKNEDTAEEEQETFDEEFFLLC